MMEKIIKDQIWAVVKADGRLVRRTSYGVQYHAGMLVSLSLAVSLDVEWVVADE
jgi:hypothetical protein